ncbi:polar amino acid ABC transporter permease [Desulfosarcina ovata subsp. sediminis]|uniref:Putative glutamine transport system permease protein GlnP n=1 Tax=Desulfosarcina ovata subsp. sediminis TaxID=885957 RepID=A0A5K7ZS33_9BACT|nr:amino acid ABC transporter permease [Desulfosarcina ovata]BBO83016.1 polar amino acid ABC transporter permease [Desulfosarcina ovata subsp. sediminis]
MNTCDPLISGGSAPAETKRHIIDWLKVVVTAGLLAGLVFAGGAELGYNWQWYRVPRYLYSVSEGHLVAGPLLRGMMVTLQVSGVSLLLSSLIGLVTAICRLSGSFTARVVARAYLELIRNTPLLVQLFFIYFVFSPLVGLSRFASAVLALSLFEGAYASEIIRAGILAVPRGQWEAAESIGLGRYRIYRHVVLPQALRHMTPPLVSQAVSLIKDSALVSTIAIYDLTMKGQEIIAETYLVFELWFTIAAIYLMLTLSLSLITRMMEKRLAMAT